MSVCTSLVAQCRHHTCYPFSETILEGAVCVLPIDHLIKEQSLLKQFKKKKKKSRLFLLHKMKSLTARQNKWHTVTYLPEHDGVTWSYYMVRELISAQELSSIFLHCCQWYPWSVRQLQVEFWLSSLSPLYVKRKVWLSGWLEAHGTWCHSRFIYNTADGRIPKSFLTFFPSLPFNIHP